jgi:small-conductance mechanosensitive channel
MTIGIVFYIFTAITHFELYLNTFKIYDSGTGLFDSANKGLFFQWENENIVDEILGLLMIVGAILATFSKEKNEDEFISKLRLESLVWSTYLNYIILLILILTVYGFDFLYVMQFNMCTYLIIAFLRFNYLLYKSRKELQNG